MNLRFVYKIIDKVEWSKIKKTSSYKGSKKDIEDGFIHFSEKDQVNRTLNHFFKDKKNLILLKIDTNNLEHLLWEQASDGNMFPHLYSSLDLSNVVDEFEVSSNGDGSHVLPDNF